MPPCIEAIFFLERAASVVVLGSAGGRRGNAPTAYSTLYAWGRGDAEEPTIAPTLPRFKIRSGVASLGITLIDGLRRSVALVFRQRG